jgi:hypothetical protein
MNVATVKSDDFYQFSEKEFFFTLFFTACVEFIRRKAQVICTASSCNIYLSPEISLVYVGIQPLLGIRIH